MSDVPSTASPTNFWLQPVTVGVLAAVVGFASFFVIVLQGLRGVGASPAEAASGLLLLCLAQDGLAIWLGLRVWRRRQSSD